MKGHSKKLVHVVRHNKPMKKKTAQGDVTCGREEVPLTTPAQIIVNPGQYELF